MNQTAENAAPVTPPAAFQLGEFRIDPSSGELEGPGGREKLDPKVMDVFVELARHSGQVVLREDLLARLWPRVVVTDEVLSRCIYELRRQLALAGGDEHYKELIETMPKRGYRLNGEVTFSAIPKPRAEPSRSRLFYPALAAIAAALITLLVVLGQRLAGAPADSRSAPAVAALNSIAVLPFTDMSEGHDQGYFSDGIAEEILNRLAHSNQLRVIARTSSFALRDQSLDVPTIAKKLGVTHVLEGSVRKAGDRIRVTAQLLTAADGSHLWSETFERRYSDAFAIQDEISTSVATALQITLAGGNSRGRPPANADAYDKFLKGDYFYFRRAPGDLERSIAYFKQAIASDPRYARAWAALAGAYRILSWQGVDADWDMQRLQGEAALRAVELDPGLAVAHWRLAQFYEETSDSKKAEEHERIARTLDPNEPLILGSLGSDAIDKGDIDKAIAIQRWLLAQDPLNGVIRQNLAVYLMADEQFDAAMSEFRGVLELNPDAGPDIEIELVRIHVLQGQDSKAFAAVSRMPKGKYRDHGLALLYRAPIHRVESDAAYARLLAQKSGGTVGVGSDIIDEIRLAEVQAFRGLDDGAFATLNGKKAALIQRWGTTLPFVPYLQHECKTSPFLKRLHADPRWAEFSSPPG